jgi:4-hydroxy-3-polyprenylbenzoate decarboxylase
VSDPAFTDSRIFSNSCWFISFDSSEFYHRRERLPSLDLPGTDCETEYPHKNMPETQEQIITVGVTGASGAILAQKILALLEEDPRVARVHLVVTEAGQRLFAEELGITSGDLKQLPSRILGHPVGKIDVLPNKDVGASIASGSYAVDSMVVIPCSMGTLGAIANGISDDLVARAADVMLKEGRKLALCVRDTPFNRVHLENMLRLQQAGAVIMPAVPAFYHQPKTIDDLVTQYVCRVLAQIGLAQEKMYRWMGTPAAKKAEA